MSGQHNARKLTKKLLNTGTIQQVNISFNGPSWACDALTMEDKSLTPAEMLAIRILAHGRFGVPVSELRRRLTRGELDIRRFLDLDLVLAYIKLRPASEARHMPCIMEVAHVHVWVTHMGADELGQTQVLML